MLTSSTPRTFIALCLSLGVVSLRPQKMNTKNGLQSAVDVSVVRDEQVFFK